MLKLEIVGSISEERTISHCSEIVDILKGFVPTNILYGLSSKKKRGGRIGLDSRPDICKFCNTTTIPKPIKSTTKSA